MKKLSAAQKEVAAAMTHAPMRVEYGDYDNTRSGIQAVIVPRLYKVRISTWRAMLQAGWIELSQERYYSETYQLTLAGKEALRLT